MKTKPVDRNQNEKREENIEIIVYQYAQNMQRLTGIHMYYHLTQSRAAVTLVRDMRKGVVEFTFIGQDGITYKVKGTLAHYEKDFRKQHEIKPENRFILYYNTQLKAWRTFQVTGLVAITCKSKL